MLSLPLLVGAVLFLVDAVVRFDHLLASKDHIQPGFYEWLFRRKDIYE